jgi:mannose-6-phosphate isomerase-like protein (cupin superfamily)
VTGDELDLTEAEPHVVRKSAAETDGEYVRFESTIYPGPGATTGADLPHERWSLDYDFEHVHPEQEERWEVVAGELQVAVDGDERTLTEGEAVTLPAGVPHRHSNPTSEPIRVVWERRPAFHDEAWAESLFALAQAGQVDDDGVPGLLQLAVTTDAYPDESVYSAAVPVWLQQGMFSALAAVGRLAGYEATHAIEEGDAVD